MDTESLYTLFKSQGIVTTDSRNCPPGSLFFALRGTSFDGNKFASQALSAGCSYAVVDDRRSPSIPVICWSTMCCRHCRHWLVIIGGSGEVQL